MLIIADTHNFESLRKGLSKFDNLISLGDIQAIDFNELKKNKEMYSKCWGAFMKKDFSNISKIEKEWFSKINIEGWKKQIEQIKKSNKNFTLCLGNSDLRMLQFFSECSQILKSAESNKFKVIYKPKLKQYCAYQILFIPYSDEKLEIQELIKKFSNKPLFILTHCPGFKNHKKEYYVNNYKLLQEVTVNFFGEIYFIHGHVHPEKSFKYSLDEFPQVTLISPKSTESDKGIGVDNEFLDLDSMELRDLQNNKKEFCSLNEEYFTKDHWNKENR